MVHRRFVRILLSAAGLVLLLASCGLLDFLEPDPEPRIGTPVPADLSYDLLVGETDSSKSFEFSNTGDADLDFSVDVSAGDDWLTIDSGASGTLTEGESQTVELSATCTSTDDETATVTISDDSGTASDKTVDVDLTCSGTNANLFLVAEVGDPAVSETFSFVNTDPVAQDFTVSGVPAWLAADVTAGSVDPGSSQDIELTADACAADGAMEATLTFDFSDKGGAPLNVLTPIELDVFSVCAAAPAGDYNITLGFFGDNFSAEIIDTFLGAASTLEELVTGELTDQVVATTDFSPGGGDNDCFSDGEGPLREAFPVDDLHIDARVPFIDGEFGVLGSAGPCFTRSSVDPDDELPYYGDMRFDSADMDRLLADGALATVILHEMLHVLGIGTLWDDFGHLEFTSADGPGVDCRLSTGFTDPPVYTGPATRTFYGVTLLGGAAEDVPAEDDGSSGTKCGHFDEQRFNTELMTGWIDDTSNELSGVTGNSLVDMDYTVDLGKVDAYAIPACGLTAPPSCVTTDLVDEHGLSRNLIAGEMPHGPRVRNTPAGGIEILSAPGE